MKNGMVLTAREATMILGILQDLQMKPAKELNTLLGSRTIEEMGILAHKMRYNDYCVEHHMTVDEMTEDDYMRDYYDRYEA